MCSNCNEMDYKQNREMTVFVLFIVLLGTNIPVIKVINKL